VAPKGGSAAAITAAFRQDQAHAYEGADPANAVRLVALLWLLSGVLTLLFAPVEAPATALGMAAVVAIGLLSIGGAIGLLRHKSAISVPGLLEVSYAGLVQVAILVSLGGGAGSAYQKLYLLWIGSAMGVHPPRRALAFLGATALAVSAPLLYDGWTAAGAANIVTSLLLWAALGMATLSLMVTVRSQRIRARADELREHELARGDSLTGLGNRRAFDEALDHEIARSRRAGSTVSVILIDVDRLKFVNDRWGHVEGDRCLVDVAQAIAKGVRAGDRSFRWGGDEFAVLLPDTDLSGAEAAAETVAAMVQQTCVDGDGAPLSVSVGPAEVSLGTDSAELVARADIELMASKRRSANGEAIPISQRAAALVSGGEDDNGPN
jgi:diguanylate cyclase (GGDEF)-like protein